MTTQDQPTDMTGPADPAQPVTSTGDNRSKGALDEMIGTARSVRLTSRSAPEETLGEILRTAMRERPTSVSIVAPDDEPEHPSPDGR